MTGGGFAGPVGRGLSTAALVALSTALSVVLLVLLGDVLLGVRWNRVLWGHGLHGNADAEAAEDLARTVEDDLNDGGVPGGLALWEAAHAADCYARVEGAAWTCRANGPRRGMNCRGTWVLSVEVVAGRFEVHDADLGWVCL